MLTKINSVLILPWLLVIQLSAVPTASAWDAVGHRHHATISWELLSPQVREELYQVLTAHPRFRQDFIQQMPAFIRTASEDEQKRWVFAQAAIWPDIVRGLAPPLRRRYHRPEWHWIDGAWLRGKAQRQGNVYVGMPALQAVPGRTAAELQTEEHIDNVVLALEYSLTTFYSADSSTAEKSVALCWVLHLIGDLHQPLHAGALFSPELFPAGDRGGNAISTDDGNLHARWDRALRGLPFEHTMEAMLATARQLRSGPVEDIQLKPEVWLQESRQALHDSVYTREIRAAVRNAEQQSRDLRPVTLTDDYIATMQDLARERIMLAGLRLSLILESQHQQMRR